MEHLYLKQISSLLLSHIRTPHFQIRRALQAIPESIRLLETLLAGVQPERVSNVTHLYYALGVIFMQIMIEQ